ncbi:MAG: aminoacyl-tRNA hydrolase [Nitrospirales bacterium]|nr:aminoacyl-tRNA hydrolase [Nitrospira sp.]MDR4503022.1 aminoacyl-tRNA hydrolase [Nitrospirales bacterium]
MNMMIKPGLLIPERALVFTASRSQGPGGQNVNKVNSRVTLHFDVVGSPFLSPAQKSRVLSVLGSRVNAEGMLRLACQKHRMQSMNRAELMDRFAHQLRQALAPKPHRVPTHASKAIKEQRLDQKKRRGQIKKNRTTVRRNED